MAKHNKPSASSDIYTAILALATFAVLATAVFVFLKCTVHYGTAWTIAGG